MITYQSYRTSLNPYKMVEMFETDIEFVIWLSNWSVSDLDLLLSDFEDKELYEYCEIILNIKKYNENDN